MTNFVKLYSFCMQCMYILGVTWIPAFALAWLRFDFYPSFYLSSRRGVIIVTLESMKKIPSGKTLLLVLVVVGVLWTVYHTGNVLPCQTLYKAVKLLYGSVLSAAGCMLVIIKFSVAGAYTRLSGQLWVTDTCLSTPYIRTVSPYRLHNIVGASLWVS